MLTIHQTLQRCTIRPWRTDDRESLSRHANDVRVSQTLRDRFPFPYTLDEADLYLARATQDDEILHQAIEVDGQAVGGIGAIPGQDVHRITAEIGYWIGHAYWGRGIGTEAVTVVTEHLLGEGFTRIEAPVFSTNGASGRVLEKCGYHLESTQVRAAIKAGVVIDLWIYVRLA